MTSCHHRRAFAQSLGLFVVATTALTAGAVGANPHRKAEPRGHRGHGASEQRRLDQTMHLGRSSRASVDASARQRNRPAHGFDSLRLSGGDGQPQNRQLTVYLPKGYGTDPNRTYPVLYMQDGQNMFEFGPAGFGNGWDVATSMEREVEAGRAEPAIIVAIFNGYGDRLSEYATISRDIGSGNQTMHIDGRADAYVDYVADVVRPHIEARYLTRTGRHSTAIGGSSMGGLVSIHGALRRPDVFGKVLASSPSLWFDKHIIERAANSQHPMDLYIDNGGVGAEGDNAPHVDRLRDVMLHRRQITGQGNVWHWFAPNASHTESAWRERFPRAYSALFSR